MGKGKKKKKRNRSKQGDGPADPEVQTATQEPGGNASPAVEEEAAGGFVWREWAHKHKRGLIVRWSSFGVALFLVAYGLRSLYLSVPSTSWWKRVVATPTNPVLGEEVPIRVGLLISLGLVLAGAYGLLYLFFRHQRVSEFMIDTETEMRKVSWPTWEELKTSTVATVVAVFLLGFYLYLVDVLLAAMFEVAFFS